MTDFASTRTDLTGLGAVLGTATAAKSGSTVTVTINDTIVTVQVARDLTVATGDVLWIAKFGPQWTALARLYTAAPGGVSGGAAPVPNPPTTSGVLTVAPVETRSYRNGAWRTDNRDVYQGQYGGGGNHTGAVFYGSAPRSLAGATVTSAVCVVRRGAGGAFSPQPTTMRLVTEAFRPAGAPTLGASVAGPQIAVGQLLDGAGGRSAFGLPTSWVQSMVDGTAGGIAFFVSAGSPYVIFAGTGSWSPAFTMTIRWTR